MSRNGNSFFFFFFDHCIANACHFSRNTWNICCIFLFLHIFFFQNKIFYLKWVQRRSKKYIPPWWLQSKKIGKPYFYCILIAISEMASWFCKACCLVFKHNCFLVSQTAAVRGKSQSLSNKTTFPTGAKMLLVSLWEYKEADIYMDVLH